MQRPFDRARIVFQSRAIAIASERFAGSCASREAEPFVRYLYERYQADGAPQGLDRWLVRELALHFRWVSGPPRWVAEESAWPYAYGRPMVFIQQCTLPENAVTKETLAWAIELYTFGVRVPGDRSCKVEYRTVEQDRDPA